MKGSKTMEENKILWIVAAVGAFLLVVLGAALIFYTPKTNTSPQIQNLEGTWTSSRETYQDQKSIGLKQNTEDYSIANPATKPYDPTAENTITIGQNAEQNVQAVQDYRQGYLTEGQSIQNLNLYAQNTNLYSENTTIDLNTVSPISNTNQNSQVSNVKDLNANTAKTNTQTKTPSPAQTSTVKMQTPAKTTSTSQATAKTTTIENRFWIQASSFSSKINAEDLKTALTKENFVSEIFTFTDNKNNLFYRVRIGPYTTKSEAEYWQGQLHKVAALKGTETYITNSSVAVR
jgi:cell division protein FtsN